MKKVQMKKVYILLGDDKSGKTTFQKYLIEELLGIKYTRMQSDLLIDVSSKYKYPYIYFIGRSIQERPKIYKKLEQHINKIMECTDTCFFLSSHLVYDDIINREIVLFLKSCTDNKLPVYNSSLLSKPPKEKERIEFKLCNFVSTGQIYKIKDTTGVSYDVKSIAEYRCQLIIRIFDDALTCAKITGQLAGAIQTFDYLEQYLDRLYVKNETMRKLTE